MDVHPGTLTAAALADAAAAVAATVVFASPAALRGVVAGADALDDGQRAALARVRLVVSAGAPVPATLLHELRAVLPDATAHTPYGMTEALPVTDITLAEIEAAGVGNGVCVGRALTGVEVALSALDARRQRTRAAGRRGRGDRRDLRARPAREGPLRPAVGHRARELARPRLAPHAATSGTSTPQGRLWVEGRLLHVITTAAGPVTPVGIEQRVQDVKEVSAAAAVGVGPAGTQQLAVVVVVEGHRRPRRRWRWRRWPPRCGMRPASRSPRCWSPTRCRWTSGTRPRSTGCGWPQWADRVLAGGRAGRRP